MQRSWVQQLYSNLAQVLHTNVIPSLSSNFILATHADFMRICDHESVHIAYFSAYTVTFSISINPFYANMRTWPNSAYFCHIFRLVTVRVFLKNCRIKPACLTGLSLWSFTAQKGLTSLAEINDNLSPDLVVRSAAAPYARHTSLAVPLPLLLHSMIITKSPLHTHYIAHLLGGHIMHRIHLSVSCLPITQQWEALYSLITKIRLPTSCANCRLILRSKVESLGCTMLQ